MRPFALLLFIAALTTSSARATTVAFSSSPSGRFAANAAHTALPNGSQFLAGTFSNPDTLSLSSGTISEILSTAGWSQFGGTGATATVGGNAGKLVGSIADETGAATAFNGKNIYVVIFNTSSASTATQMGVFRAPSATTPWVFPTSGGIGDEVTLDLDDTTVAAIGGAGSVSSSPLEFVLSALASPPSYTGKYATAMIGSGTVAGQLAATVSATQNVTGSVSINGKTYALKGAIQSDGSFSQTIKVTGKPDVVIALTFSQSGGFNSVAGSVTTGDGTFTVSSNTMLATTLPSGLTAGAYTLRFLPPSDTTLPRGFGYATGTLSKLGALKLAGKLGDGTPFTASSYLQVNSSAQFYLPLYVAPKGWIYAVLHLRSQTKTDADGIFVWSKPKPTKPGTQLYPDGFGPVTITIEGSIYTAPKTGSNILTYSTPTAPTADLTFADGDVTTFTRTVHLSLADKMTSVENLATGEKLTLTLTRSSGLFAGTHRPAGSTKTTAFGGVLLQRSTINDGDGVFLGTTESGSVTFKTD